MCVPCAMGGVVVSSAARVQRSQVVPNAGRLRRGVHRAAQRRRQDGQGGRLQDQGAAACPSALGRLILRVLFKI